MYFFITQVGEFLALSKDKFHLRTSHSVLLGYWTTELGGLNQVVHLWEYGRLQSWKLLDRLNELNPFYPPEDLTHFI